MSQPKVMRPLAEERRREIVAMLSERGRISVHDVVRRFGVSSVTARSDLDALSEIGALVRSHGGGIKPLTVTPEHPLKVREGMHHVEKSRIARAAWQCIRPMQTLILCTGSTSAALAEEIARSPHKNLTVITYALDIALRLSNVPGLTLILLGGFFRYPSTALVGPHAEQMMRSLHADQCFMSTVGLEASTGLTTLDIMEAQLNRQMMEAAAEVTVLADSSKFGHRSLSLISDFQRVKRVITDVNAPSPQVEKLRAMGIETFLV